MMKHTYQNSMREMMILGAAGLLFHAAPVWAASPVQTCTDLTSFTLSSASIGVPGSTSGAIITSATVAQPGAGTGELAEYCRVVGAILPQDITAPNIIFEVHLPTNWNQKAMMFGGGGFNGTFSNRINLTYAGSSSQLSARARGYAVFVSNSGHIQPAPTAAANWLGRYGAFATNEEALRNFTGDALKKTRDTSMAVIAAYYGSAPQKTYFQGGSTGGREAIIAMQRWPQDFDGIISLFPALEFQSWFQQTGRISAALSLPGAYMNNAKRQLVHDAVISACDSLDGIADGVISNVPACNSLFSSDTNVGASLRCQDGADTGDTCLSDAQLNVLNTMNTKAKLAFKLANGSKSSPGFNVWSGIDLGYPDDQQPLLAVYGLNSVAPAFPVGLDQPVYTVFFDQWLRYFVTGDANFNSVGLTSRALLPYRARLDYLSLLQNDRLSDLSAFSAKGGKLLMMHGLADSIISPKVAEQFYKSVQKSMGKSTVANFVRLYEVPGYGHSVSSDFDAGWDAMTALEDWVENGVAPVNQIVQDKRPLQTRTRPLCEYPSWPRYNGSGDANLASSFHCASDNEADDADDELDD